MTVDKETTCPKCGGNLKYYDSVKRIVRTKRRLSKYVVVPRLKCQSCHSIHRNLPDYLFPYKQYESDIITGVLEGLITADTFGFEDYPCEMTMLRWKMCKPDYL